MRLLRVWWPTALFGVMVIAAYSLSPASGSFVEGLVNLVVYGAFSLTEGWILAFIGFCAIVSLFIRMRRAAGPERQQVKWFVYAVAVFPVLLLAAMAADMILDAQVRRGDHLVDFLLIMLGAILIPVAMGISILKYRLYDIDLVVNRTLVYGTLTALLAAAYFALIVLLQRVLPLDGDSDIAVAASTLAVAGLFQPLRSRVQAFIDHRFYRRKYDAAATLQDFTGRLRDQVDLPSLSDDLLWVVGRTIQPAHASLWLRSEVVR